MDLLYDRHTLVPVLVCVFAIAMAAVWLSNRHGGMRWLGRAGLAVAILTVSVLAVQSYLLWMQQPE